jgi:uncharacterized protein YndB with AHSA1/START domain
VLAGKNVEVKIDLPSEREIALTCRLKRSSRLLFEAWTKPEHLRNWWGCEGSTITVCEVDLRVGGEWRIVLRMADGRDHPFRGIYHEIVPNLRLVYSERYEQPDLDNPEWLTTVSFEEAEGGTLLTHRILHRSREERDGHLRAGMEEGTAQSMRRLNDHTATMPDSTLLHNK